MGNSSRRKFIATQAPLATVAAASLTAIHTQAQQAEAKLVFWDYWLRRYNESSCTGAC